MPTIGPTGKFPLGKPMMSGDLGGIIAATTVDRQNRMLVMNFGTGLSWLGAPISEMRGFAKIVRQQILDNFGRMPYDKTTLPIRVNGNKETGIIELHLPRPASVLAANPEMWLALAEVIEDRIKEMTQD